MKEPTVTRHYELQIKLGRHRRSSACLPHSRTRRERSERLLWYHKVDGARAWTIDRARETTQASKRRCQTISNENAKQRTENKNK